VTTSLRAAIQPRFLTVDGLAIRYAESEGPGGGAQALLLSPWPESVYAYEATWPRLAEHARLIAVDLPGFGHSERRAALMTPSAMGEFVLRLADAFGLEHPHVVGPDVATSASIFAAALQPDRFRSVVVGSGGAAYPLQLGKPLIDWIEAPDIEPYRRTDGRQIVAEVMSRLERYTPSAAAREDYLSAYAGEKFAASMAYVRAYPADIPTLHDRLGDVRTPVLIIAGRKDRSVPPVNAEFLHERLPVSELAIIEAGHFTWEDAADEYAALVTDWWERGAAAARLDE
jgi:pimeloyl-ACP methyl ester carboxylesterase